MRLYIDWDVKTAVHFLILEVRTRAKIACTSQDCVITHAVLHTDSDNLFYNILWKGIFAFDSSCL